MGYTQSQRPKSVPTNYAVDLDEIDRRILQELVQDARLPNNVIAGRVGVAPSTCSLRIRRLVANGVVRGYRAELDPAALGLPIQAMIALRLHSSARPAIGTVARRLGGLPGVLNVYFLSGANDFLVQVAVASPEALRQFVSEHLNASREFASTETSLVFEHVHGSGV